MVSFHHILAPVDFEPCSEHALDVAIDLASQFDARLTVLHVWDIPAAAYPGMVSVSPEIWATLAEAAQQGLDRTMARVRERLPGAHGLLVRGQAAAEILTAVEGVKADLVVIGTHGRHGLPRMLLGSVAEKVVRTSPVPVLTVRSPAGSPSTPAPGH